MSRIQTRGEVTHTPSEQMRMHESVQPFQRRRLLTKGIPFQSDCVELFG
jgi:hypothetical protein